MISFEIEGLDKIIHQLETIKSGYVDVVEKSLNKSMGITRDYAKSLCTVGDTGHLRESIRSEVKVIGNSVFGVVYTNVSYGAYVEFGTGKVGETSKPISANKLGITYKQDKWLVNIPSVGVRYIAGMKARPFMYPAILSTKDKIRDNLINDINSYIRSVM